MPRPGPRHDILLVTATLLGLVVAVTWPLALRLTSAVPADLGDPLLNTFILGWDARRLAHGLAGLWDAPFYFPYHNTLAYSEHLLGVAVFTAPLQWISGNEVLAYNAAFIGAPVLAGVGAYGLTRDLWGRRDAAWIAAIALAFAPNRVDQLSHLQVLMNGWMPMALWALHRYFGTGSRLALAGFVAAFSLQGLSNGYFLYFFAIAVVIIGGAEYLAMVARGMTGALSLDRALRTTLELVAGALIVGALLLPVARAYYAVQQDAGLRRSASEAEMFSARPTDYLRASSALVVWGPRLGSAPAERSVFPGFTIVLLAFVGLGAALVPATARADDPPFARRRVAAYAVLAAAAFWLSLGTASPLYRWLMEVVPGFDGLRVPARFNVVVALALAVLGAAGTARLCQWVGRPARSVALVVGLGALIFAEGYGGPLPLETFRPSLRQRASLHDWLRTQPAGAMLELPIAGPDLAPFTLVYQFATLHHGRPIVNGYSGWGSPIQEWLAHPFGPLQHLDRMDALLEGLSRIGVRYVLLNRSEYSRSVPGVYTDHQPLVDAINRSRWVELSDTFLPTQVWRLRTPTSSLPEVPRDASPLEATRDFSLVNAPDDEGPLEVRLARAEDVAVVELNLPGVNSGSYPLNVTIESIDAAGVGRVLFDGPVVTQVLQGLAARPRSPRITLPLPSNTSTVLRISHVGSRGERPWRNTDLALSRR